MHFSQYLSTTMIPFPTSNNASFVAKSPQFLHTLCRPEDVNWFAATFLTEENCFIIITYQYLTNKNVEAPYINMATMAPAASNAGYTKVKMRFVWNDVHVGKRCQDVPIVRVRRQPWRHGRLRVRSPPLVFFVSRRHGFADVVTFTKPLVAGGA